ncbi:MAG: hypothetical protein MGU50_04165 [Trichodesmium sp. MAG_R02]|nr:hypothetical protein [Trichodesmium sp. MAG_R02]
MVSKIPWINNTGLGLFKLSIYLFLDVSNSIFVYICKYFLRNVAQIASSYQLSSTETHLQFPATKLYRLIINTHPSYTSIL